MSTHTSKIAIENFAVFRRHCKEFPEGWSMWMHMEEDKLSYILGDMLLSTIQHLLAE